MRVAYLAPSFYRYRVPVFDALHRRLGDDFVVITNRWQRDSRSTTAQTMGAFPRMRLLGYQFVLSRAHVSGDKTPLGLTVTPSLPLALLRLRPDVVVSANFNVWTLVSLLLGLRTIVFWEGTPHTERTVSPWRSRLRRWMVRKAAALVVNGKLSRAYVESLGASPLRIYEGGLCAEAPPPNHAATIHGARKDSRTIRFLFVGRLIGGKGADHLLRAASILRSRNGHNRRFSVRIVGDGPERSNLAETCRMMDLEDVVEFLGDVPPEDIWQYYADADVFVLPTLQDNWPLVVPEAMSMGLPVLLSKLAGSTPDLIREGINGASFDPADHNRLAGLMQQYVDDPSLLSIQGTASREIARAYNADTVTEVFVQAIDSIAKA